jgi:cysteine desulfurase
MEQFIYLDNNATTQVDPRVLEATLPYLTTHFGNASSIHQYGLNANEAVRKARYQVAELIGAESNEIIFTSGSTEAINLAIKGIADTYLSKGKHIVTALTEHPAVLDTCRDLETKGFEITYLPVESDGLLDLSLVKSVLREDTILVSIMLANNETGVIQPIKKIAELAHDVNAVFLSDATQAVGKIPIDVDDLGIDLLCLSGHKFYAPKGVGSLFVRHRNRSIKLTAIQHGGGHENGLRSGTLNVPGIVALGSASSVAQESIETDSEKIRVLRDKLESELLKVTGSLINGCTESRMFNVSNICFRGFDANVMMSRMRNIAVSNGSACSSAIFKPSHVLTAMGLSSDDAFSSIRFSLGKFNTNQDVDVAVERFMKLFQ